MCTAVWGSPGRYKGLAGKRWLIIACENKVGAGVGAGRYLPVLAGAAQTAPHTASTLSNHTMFTRDVIHALTMRHCAAPHCERSRRW